MPAIIIVGLGFGDEGKGSVTDFLCRDHEASLVIRFNGGAQAAHNVVLPDGSQHTFAQFGSGTLAGAKTHLSQYMLVNPITMDNEAEALEKLVPNPFELVTFDQDALVTNPYQVAANRSREKTRGASCHGSCGMGIGETVEDALCFPDMVIRVRDLRDKAILREKLLFSRDLKSKELGALVLAAVPPLRGIGHCFGISDVIERFMAFGQKINIVDSDWLPVALREHNTVIFEGAQGVLLDQDWGFHPHTTWANTTFDNAYKLLEGYNGDIRRVGVIRGYMTRHGAGPLPTETQASNIFPDTHNTNRTYQGNFRVGYFDSVLVRYALRAIGGVDEIILTNLDKLNESTDLRICTNYNDCFDLPIKEAISDLPFQENLTQLLMRVTCSYQNHFRDLNDFVRAVEEQLNTPVSLRSFGPTYKDKIYGHEINNSKTAFRCLQEVSSV